MKKQAWMGDAIATTVGWVNPKTNEILVAARGLPDAVPFDAKGNYSVNPVAKSTTPEVTQEVAPEVSEAGPEVSEIIPVPEATEAPKKKSSKK